MRYRLLAIGKLKRGFYQAGCQHYLERLQAYAKVELIEVKEAKGIEQESAALLAAAQGYVVALDEAGELLSTQQLADKLTWLELRGISLLSLLIGGANGHSQVLKRQADALWSLSPLTLPHELARLVILEQLYRVETLRAGHPYHRA
ncbi:MAG: 23S rRNA (pseudouridine(1915)-N(3))-methyltransferase RlmH [Truepera sp.]|nr:23S rRNA (pseudouridine(1915)-N(3))-methyltransferase RlmH [Truepera sp.]